MPHEIFLTAVVKSEDAIKARAILGGFTEMRERHRFTKIRYMYRPQFSAGVKGLPTVKDLQKERSPNAPLWQELHQIFLKQSYIIQDRVDVTDEATNAILTGAPVAIAAGKMHKLRFDDLPDVVSSHNPPKNTQRKMLEIVDPRLEKILADNKFVVKSDSIEESYHWWHNNLEYALVRTIPLTAGTFDPHQVPDLHSIENPFPFCLLFVRIQVESSPEPMHKAHLQLESARQDLTGIFDFKTFDRRTHDTRHIEPRLA